MSVQPNGRAIAPVARLLCGFILCSTLVRAEILATDDTGNPVSLPAPARRVISLAPHATELLYSAGIGRELVGVSAFSDFPPAARRITRVGDSQALDLEAITAMQPDLVIIWGSGTNLRQVESLRRLRLPIFVSEPRELEDIPRTIETFGRLLGTESKASVAAGDFRTRLDSLGKHFQARRSVKVFVQIWDHPVTTINREHLIAKVVSRCAGVGIFNQLPALTPVVDIESVLARDPEVIIATGSAQETQAWLVPWRRWMRMSAVRNGQLYAIHADLLTRHSARILDGAQQLCQALERTRVRSNAQ